MLADVVRARAAYYSLDPDYEALTAWLESLADYIESHAPGTSRETLTILETQAKRYEIVFGFPDLGGQASDALAAVADDHVEKLREVAALALLDAYDELRENTLDLPRYALQDGLAAGYGLHPHEVEAAIDGIELHAGYFAGDRTADGVDAARAAMPQHVDDQRSAGSARRPPRRSGRRRGR